MVFGGKRLNWNWRCHFSNCSRFYGKFVSKGKKSSIRASNFFNFWKFFVIRLQYQTKIMVFWGFSASMKTKSFLTLNALDILAFLAARGKRVVWRISARVGAVARILTENSLIISASKWPDHLLKNDMLTVYKISHFWYSTYTENGNPQVQSLL